MLEDECQLTYVFLKLECETTEGQVYSVRFYKNKVDTRIAFQLLPQFIGSGIVKINGYIASVIATTIDGKLGKLEKHHVDALITELKRMNCLELTWERHKKAKLKQVKFKI